MYNYVRFSGNNPFGVQAKMVLHFNQLYEYLTTDDTSCPICMEVGLINRCNMNCRWCITENGKTGEVLEIEVLKKFLKDFSEMGGKAITYCGQGEPTLYQQFEEAVLAAKENDIRLGLMTNGVYKEKYSSLIGKNFEWVRISLDTLNPIKYKEWKGIDGVKIVKKNVRNLLKFPAKVGINCNIGSDITIEHVKQLIEWVDNTDGIAYLQFRPILPRYYKKAETIEINLEIWEYLNKYTRHPKINLSDDKRYDIKNKTAFDFRSCEGYFFEPILDASGEVKICTYHPSDKRFSFGNIYQSSFKDIWCSMQKKEAIKFVRNFDYKNECQVCCKLCESNKLIDFLTHPEEYEDLHFL